MPLEKSDGWIKDKFYDESVYCVITKALADCEMKVGEFANMNAPDFKIVEFDAKPYKQEFTAENWSAVILWNYVAEAYYGNVIGDHELNDAECIAAIGKKVYDYYNEKHAYNLDLVEQAIRDIKAYVKALNLGNEIRAQKKWKMVGNAACATVKPKGFWANGMPITGHATIRGARIALGDGKFVTSDVRINVTDGKMSPRTILNGVKVKSSEALEVEEIVAKVDIFSDEYMRGVLESWARQSYRQEAMKMTNAMFEICKRKYSHQLLNSEMKKQAAQEGRMIYDHYQEMIAKFREYVDAFKKRYRELKEETSEKSLLYSELRPMERAEEFDERMGLTNVPAKWLNKLYGYSAKYSTTEYDDIA